MNLTPFLLVEDEDRGPMHPHDTFLVCIFLIPEVCVNRISFVPIKNFVPWGSF